MSILWLLVAGICPSNGLSIRMELSPRLFRTKERALPNHRRPSRGPVSAAPVHETVNNWNGWCRILRSSFLSDIDMILMMYRRKWALVVFGSVST